jgi:hypothetical protein
MSFDRLSDLIEPVYNVRKFIRHSVSATELLSYLLVDTLAYLSNSDYHILVSHFLQQRS